MFATRNFETALVFVSRQKMNERVQYNKGLEYIGMGTNLRQVNLELLGKNHDVTALLDNIKI